MDSGYLIILDALRRMESRLCAVLDCQSVGPERRVAGFALGVAGSDLVGNTIDDLGRPVFDTYVDDIDDGPVFDADPVDLEDEPVFDTELVPDRVAVAVLEFVKSAFNVFGQGPDDLPSAHVSASIDEGPLFDEEHVREETESSIGSGVAAPATTIDAPSTCSTKCLHLAVNTDLVGRYCCDNAGEKLITGSLQVYSEMEEAGSLYPLYVLFNAYCSGDGGRGWHKVLFHEDLGSLIPVQGIITTSLMDIQSVFSNVIVVDGFDQKFWDPGSSVGSKFSWFGADLEPAHHHELDIANASQMGFRSVLSASVETDGFASKCWDPGLAGGSGFMEVSKYRADFHWDLGSPEGLQSIVSLRSGTDFAPAYLHGLPIEGLQRFWDPGALDSFKSMDFTGFSESIFCTCEDGMVSGQPNPPWLMCDAEFVCYETLFGRLPEFDVENAEWTEASVQFWYEDAYRYLKQRKCGGIGKLARLKWNSSVLLYSSENAVSRVYFQTNARNIISLSLDAMTVGNLLLKRTWPPPVLLNNTHDGVVMRLMSWLSFCYHDIAEYYKVGKFWEIHERQLLKLWDPGICCCQD